MTGQIIAFGEKNLGRTKIGTSVILEEKFNYKGVFFREHHKIGRLNVQLSLIY